MKFLEFYTRITKIMKIKLFHTRINKKIKLFETTPEITKNNEIRIIIYQNHENHKN